MAIFLERLFGNKVERNLRKQGSEVNLEQTLESIEQANENLGEVLNKRDRRTYRRLRGVNGYNDGEPNEPLPSTSDEYPR